MSSLSFVVVIVVGVGVVGANSTHSVHENETRFSVFQIMKNVVCRYLQYRNLDFNVG